MDRFLAIDLGNTHLTWGIFEGERLASTGALPVLGAWALPVAEGGSFDDAAAGSVNREAEQKLLERWRGGPALTLFGPGRPVPVETLGPDPRHVGTDRLLNALAWRHLQGVPRPAVIVDLGTAITLDLVSARGEYRGGLILPGPGLISRALDLGTSLLPRVEIHPTAELFGRDTDSAVRRGVFGLLAGGVSFHLTELRRGLEPETVFLATGGGAATYAPWFDGIEMVIPHLTLEGIRLAAGWSRGG